MPKTLLLADDSVTIQKVVGLTFANEDVVLVSVDNGDDAIMKAREIRPDFVLADVVMPGRNGYEVCEAIKSDTRLRHVPVLLLSGTFETFDEERARIAGADGHITKPFEAQALIDTVNRLLARAAATATTAAAPAATPVPATNADAEISGSSFDFFDDDLLGASASRPRVSVASTTPAPVPAWATTASDATRVATPPASPFGEPIEANVLELREEDSLDVVTDDSDDDVSAATRALFSDDTDLEAAVGTGVLEDEEPLDLALDQAPRLPAASPPRVLDDPLEPLARSASGLAPKTMATDSSDLSWPSSYAASGRLGSSAFDLSFREETPVAARAVDPFLGAPAVESSAAFDVTRAETSATGSDPFAATAPPPRAEALELVIPVTAELAEPMAAVALEEDDDVLEATPLVADEETEDDSPFATISFADPTADEDAAPLAFRSTAEPAEPAAPAAASSGATRAAPPPNLDPLVRRRIHDTLEKVAWEAFADLSDTIVRQVIERVEQIAWEVIPQMAETLVREEIRRMKGDEGPSDPPGGSRSER